MVNQEKSDCQPKSLLGWLEWAVRQPVDCANAMRVLIWLAKYAKADETRPGRIGTKLDRMCTELRISEKTFGRGIAKLEAAGLVDVERNGRGKYQACRLITGQDVQQLRVVAGQDVPVAGQDVPVAGQDVQVAGQDVQQNGNPSSMVLTDLERNLKQTRERGADWQPGEASKEIARERGMTDEQLSRLIDKFKKRYADIFPEIPMLTKKGAGGIWPKRLSQRRQAVIDYVLNDIETKFQEWARTERLDAPGGASNQGGSRLSHAEIEAGARPGESWEQAERRLMGERND